MSFPQALHRLQHLKYLTSSSLAVVGDDDDGEGDASRGIVDGGCDVEFDVDAFRFGIGGGGEAVEDPSDDEGVEAADDDDAISEVYVANLNKYSEWNPGNSNCKNVLFGWTHSVGLFLTIGRHLTSF